MVPYVVRVRIGGIKRITNSATLFELRDYRSTISIRKWKLTHPNAQEQKSVRA
jgi:hypothetical protein